MPQPNREYRVYFLNGNEPLNWRSYSAPSMAVALIKFAAEFPSIDPDKIEKEPLPLGKVKVGKLNPPAPSSANISKILG